MNEVMPVVERYVDWNASIILVVSVIVVILFIVARMMYPDYYKLTMYRMFVENFSGRPISRPTEVSSIEAVTIIISLLSISTMGFAVICYSDLTGISMEHGSEWKVMLIVLVSFTVYNHLRGLINLFSGFLFRLQDYVRSYNTLILDTERLLSILFLPLFSMCPFVPAEVAKVLVWIAIALFVALVILQYVTIFFHLLKNNFLNHHSFLYFCALEVLPVLITVRLVL
ncbi:MAG: DUF4271 domain-containing protein [Bacteroidales bacterium]|nr:DUF4271 domain-containing protein [Bacteroidales bacterium]